MTSEEGHPVYLNSIETIQKKIDYCADYGGGIMIWEIGQDCFDGNISIQDSMYTYIYENKVGTNSLDLIEFEIFPNPSHDLIQVSLPAGFDCTYNLVNQLGQTVMKGSFKEAQFIDISPLNSGLYYMEINDQKHKFKRAEIIKK